MSEKEFLTLKEACEWASSYLERQVTESNISYLIQYGKIRRYDEEGNLKKSSGGVTKVSVSELERYYNTKRKGKTWKEYLGEDIDRELIFGNVRESERTKHVHRLHPYKGKFIPQLVEYFLDGHTDNLKKSVFFHKGDTVLDPFVGSGTTLVQCLELGLHSIGIDISEFNCMISEVKVQKYDLVKLSNELREAAKATERFIQARFGYDPQNDFDQLLSAFNKKYYPSPEFKILIGLIHEYQSTIEKEINTLSEDIYTNGQVVETVLNHHKHETVALQNRIMSFLHHSSIPIQFEVSPRNIENLVNAFSSKYAEFALRQLDEEIRNIKVEKQTTLDTGSAEAFANAQFLSKWFTERQRMEMQCYLDQIDRQDRETQKVMKIILSRAVRSCRATTHVDLATLIKPQSNPYYCRKHFKICRPITTIIRHLRRYTEDTIKRLRKFSKLRREVFCEVINADSRTIDLFDCIEEKNLDFHRILRKKKIDGIFTSPPYVGHIDYHEQHAYSYELFNIDRKDYLEIGKKSEGTSRRAQSNYIAGISAVLLNAKEYLKTNAQIFIVANDSKNLYRKIADASGLEIIKEYRRPVMNRTERDKQPYFESIFHMAFK